MDRNRPRNRRRKSDPEPLLNKLIEPPKPKKTGDGKWILAITIVLLLILLMPYLIGHAVGKRAGLAESTSTEESTDSGERLAIQHGEIIYLRTTLDEVSEELGIIRTELNRTRSMVNDLVIKSAEETETPTAPRTEE